MAESHREEIAKLEALYAGNPGGRVFVHLAEAYRKAGEHERARRILDEGLARHTDSASGYVVLGRVLADMQITAEAEIAFRRVLELDGGNLVALRWLGDIARQSGRNRDAALHYRELLTRNPSNEEVRDLVEIVEREAESGAGGAGTAPGDGVAEAFAGLDEAARDEAALAEPLSDAEEHAVTAPAPVAEGPEPDMTSWSTAPGQTGDAEEPPVEYGLVELDTSAVSEAAAPGQEWQDTDAAEPAGGAEESTSVHDWAEDESDVVASTDDDDTVELEELRRDDEAEPIEIHLLDPSYEPSEREEDEAYAGELDLSDLATAGPLEDADDYADDTFVANLAPSAPPEDVDDYADDTFVADLAPSAPPEDADDYADDTFVASLAPSAPLEDADDYADETFVADLSAAGQEEPPPDELPGGVDVMQAGDALTLLPDEGETGTDTSEPPAAEQEVPQDTSEVGMAAPEPAQEPGELSDAGLSALAGAAEPAAEATVPAAEVPRGADVGLVTETMAILYRSQGFHDRAAEVYRALLEARPGDERLAARLREAEEAAGAAARPKTEDDAGEVWLRGVGAAWTGPTDSATEDATPYTWTAESEEAEAGEPIGSYLQDLVSWKAGSTAWRQTEPEPQAQEQADFEMPDWLDGPGGSESWTPDAEPAGFPPAPAAESDWSPAQPAEHEPWVTIPPAGEGVDAAAPDAEAAVPWEPESQPVVHPAGGGEAGAAGDGDETDGGWTPMELLDNDMPSAGAVPADAGGPDAAPVQEDSSDDDDDDLEMFRSWLQSLKK